MKRKKMKNPKLNSIQHKEKIQNQRELTKIYKQNYKKHL